MKELSNFYKTLDLVIYLEQRPDFVRCRKDFGEWILLFEKPEDFLEVSISLNRIHHQTFENRFLPILKYKHYCIGLFEDQYVLSVKKAPMIKIFENAEDVWEGFVKKEVLNSLGLEEI